MRRRNYLAMVGGISTVGIAGCLGSDSPGSSGNSSNDDDNQAVESSDAFQAIEFTTTSEAAIEWRVTVSDDVKKVNVINEDGANIESFSYAEGETTASTLAATPRGTYEYVAVNGDGEEITTIPQTYQPEVEFRDLRAVADIEGLSKESYSPSGEHSRDNWSDYIYENESEFTRGAIDIVNTGDVPINLYDGPVAVEGRPQILDEDGNTVPLVEDEVSLSEASSTGQGITQLAPGESTTRETEAEIFTESIWRVGTYQDSQSSSISKSPEKEWAYYYRNEGETAEKENANIDEKDEIDFSSAGSKRNGEVLKLAIGDASANRYDGEVEYKLRSQVTLGVNSERGGYAVTSENSENYREKGDKIIGYDRLLYLTSKNFVK